MVGKARKLAKQTELIYLLAFLITFVGNGCSKYDVRIASTRGSDVRLAYRSIGSGYPLIVIHDGPGYEKSLLYPGFDALSEEMRVIYYDQRGCGDSEPLTPHTPLTIADNVDDLEWLRRNLGLSRFSIAAHGWGAVIAVNYVIKYGECVDELILVTPISPFRPEVVGKNIIDKLPSNARIEVLDIISNPYLSMLDKREGIMRQVLYAMPYRPNSRIKTMIRNAKLSPDVSLRLGSELASMDLSPILNQIDMPSLVIIGKHDLITLMREQMAYADELQNCVAVVFNESGHLPFLEEPDFFVAVVKEFLLKNRIPPLVRDSVQG